LCCGSDSVSSFYSGGGLVATALQRWALHGGGLLGVVASASILSCFNFGSRLMFRRLLTPKFGKESDLWVRFDKESV
jgi:hypothetical protein